MPSYISICGARLHNLKNISLDIPKHQFVALTGLSGSGKSTLGIDILYKEGQRQYLEALGLVTYGVSKPPFDVISGLSPSVSVEQHLTNQSPRSTVGTVSEVYTYLRLLFARLGQRPCPACQQAIPPLAGLTAANWQDEVADRDDLETPEECFACPHCGAPVPKLSMANFSFNKPAGACPVCTGLGFVQEADLSRLVNPELSIHAGAVQGWDAFHIEYHGQVLLMAGRHYGITFDLDKPVKQYTPLEHDLLFYGVESERFQRHVSRVDPPTSVRKGRFEGVATSLMRRYAERIHDTAYRQKMEPYILTQTCPKCEGSRLRRESRAVTIGGQDIAALSRLPLDELVLWLNSLPAVFNMEEMSLARPVLDDLLQRCGRLQETGVGYLTLERATPSLSAGEAQRLRLACLIGSGLTGVLYVLDEPTTGLHQRDTQRLVNLLRRLRDLGNSVLVIEHDLELIRSADYVIDIGPGAGKHGGQIVALGTPAEVAGQPGSITAAYLAGQAALFSPRPRRRPSGQTLAIVGARQHNLKNITVQIPLGVLVVVTGVSGSGKSSLIFDILERAGRQHFYAARQPVGAHESILGWQHIDKIVTISQEPAGRLTRSNAAASTEVYTPLREAFAAQPEAVRRGFTLRHFSFNLPADTTHPGGRCEHCQGSGVLAIKMHFLPDVEVRCPACHGRRFQPETLAVKYAGYDIAQVLELTAEEALGLFKDIPAAAYRLQVLCDVGLGYLQLGQPASTLSAGEVQRVKLAKELGRRAKGHTLYLLDEPTIGLHPADTARLLAILQRLVEAGNTVVVVEHNLQVIQSADWLIDLGPEGGAGGGWLVAEGTPEQVAAQAGSHTGQCLAALSGG